MPLILALFTAVLFEPIIRRLQKLFKTENRFLLVTLCFGIFVVTCVLATYITVTYLIDQIIKWAYQIPRYALEIQLFAEQLIQEINDFIATIPQNYLLVLELERNTQQLTAKGSELAQELILTLTSWIQSIPNLIIVTLIYLIALFLISYDFPRLRSMFYSLFHEETAERVQYMFAQLGKVFLGYWKAQFWLSILIFVLTYACLYFMAPDLALIMSIIIWFVDIIPLYVGPSLVLVPWGIYAYIVGDTSLGIQLFLLALGLLILRRIIEPKVLGDQIGLSALATVLSMYFGFVFFGVMGLILGPFVVIGFRSAKEAGFFNIDLNS